MKLLKVKVTITKSKEYPTPNGLEYEAKGAYRQDKSVVVVGNIATGDTMRLKYPAEDVEFEWIEDA